MQSPTRIEEVTLDRRRRTSLAEVGRKGDRKYLAEEYEDGTIVLVPAATVSTVELAVLRDGDLRDRVRRAPHLERSELRHRGRFASDADEDA